MILFCSNFGRLVILIIISLIAYRSDTSFFKYFLSLFCEDFFQIAKVPQSKTSCDYSNSAHRSGGLLQNLLYPRRLYSKFPI